MAVGTVEPLVTIVLPDGRTVRPERRRGDPLRRYRPPRPDSGSERRAAPRRDDPDVRGRTLDLFA
jgi:hypothetical protein